MSWLPQQEPGQPHPTRIACGTLLLLLGLYGCDHKPTPNQINTGSKPGVESTSTATTNLTEKWELTGDETTPLPTTGSNLKVAPLLEAAEKLVQEKRFTEAAERLQKIVREFPDSDEAHFTLGFVLNHLGRPEEAIKEYQATLQLVPDYAEAHNNLGNLLIKLKRPAEAVPHFESIIKNDPKNSLAENNLGTAFANLGKLAEAIPHFNRAVQLNGDYADAWFNLGSSYTVEKRWNEAILPLETALKLRPELDVARRLLIRARQQSASPKQP